MLTGILFQLNYFPLIFLCLPFATCSYWNVSIVIKNHLRCQFLMLH